MRSKGHCHEKDITCADYYHKLGLVATGAQDKCVKLFDYETLREKKCWANAHKSEVTLVHFIDEFPLLLTSDLDGHLYIWHTDDKATGDTSYACVLQWSNTPGVMRTSLITTIDSYYKPAAGKQPRQFLLVLGDETGMVRIEDIGAILDHPKLADLKPAELPTNKRNPHRTFKDDKEDGEGTKKADGKGETRNTGGEEKGHKKILPLCNESTII